MTQIFKADGTVVPVTKIQAGPCLVLQKKTEDRDGYVAFKCGFGQKAKVIKPLLGVFQKFGHGNFRFVREFRATVNDPVWSKVNEGDEISPMIFTPGDMVNVEGVTKGRGFQGVVKRHGFAGGKKSHGHKDQLRMPGSIGCTGPQRVFKGKRMGGRMGNDQVTVQNLEVIAVDNEALYVKGAVPGARNGLLQVRGLGDFEIVKPVVEVPVAAVEPVIEVEAPVVETPVVENVVVEETPVVETPVVETQVAEAPVVEAPEAVEEVKPEDVTPVATEVEKTETSTNAQ